MTFAEYQKLDPAAQQAAWAQMGPEGQAALKAEKQAQPGALKSAFLGGVDALTLGWGDEMKARVRSAIDGSNYEDWLKQTRGEQAAATAAHPGAHAAGQVVGTIAPALIPGAGELALARTGGGMAAGGAAGALSGWGHSEATDAAGQAKDAALGFGMGATAAPIASTFLSGVTRMLGASVSRALEKQFQKIAASSGLTADQIVARINAGDDLASMGIEVTPTLRAAINRMRTTPMPASAAGAATTGGGGLGRTALGGAADLAGHALGSPIPIGRTAEAVVGVGKMLRGAGLPAGQTARLARLLIEKDPAVVEAALAGRISGRELVARAQGLMNVMPGALLGSVDNPAASGQNMLDVMMQPTIGGGLF